MRANMRHLVCGGVTLVSYAVVCVAEYLLCHGVCVHLSESSHTSLTLSPHPPSLQGPYFDLFLFSVLLNRMEMAYAFFLKCQYPVRNALTAVCLLRKMSEISVVDPLVSKSMMENSDFFEKIAVGVQLQAFKLNQSFAEESSRIPLFIWRRYSLLDLAMEAHCNQYVEACCAASTKDLGFGDIYQAEEWIYTKIVT